MTQPKKGRVFLISISAIPGAGKTSAIKRFQETAALENALKTRHNLNPHIVFVREPEDMWIERVNGKEYNWLREFYEDRDTNAHPFQMLVFHTHVEVVERARDDALAANSEEKDVLLIVERSMYDQLLFWKLQVDDKLASTSAIHDSSYMKIWSRWNQFIPEVSLVFFFHTSNLQGTMKRLRKREATALKRSPISMDRSVFHLSTDSSEDIEEADGIPLAYQEALLRKHEEWYTTPQTSFPKEANGQIPCVRVNVDAPYHEDDIHLHQLAEEMAGPIARILLNGGECAADAAAADEKLHFQNAVL